MSEATALFRVLRPFLSPTCMTYDNTCRCGIGVLWQIWDNRSKVRLDCLGSDHATEDKETKDTVFYGVVR